MFDDYDPYQPMTTQKLSILQIEVRKNRKPEISCKISLSKSDFKDRELVIKLIYQSLQLKHPNLNEIRLFSYEGLELFDQDMRFIKDNDILYVSEDEDFDVSSYFGQYQKIKDLGAGGFGEVILGIDKITREKYAIKITRPEKIKTASDVSLIFSEASTLQRLTHPNIVKLHHCFMDKKTFKAYLVMEYLEGGELLDFLKEKGKLSEEEALCIFQQLIRAIEYCHRSKTIHRDLKLENILRVSKTSDQFKIVDFGIAGLFCGNMADITNVGSFHYLSPEVLRERSPRASPGMDIWALGCILHAMVVGVLPFTGRDKKEIKDKIMVRPLKIHEEHGLSIELTDLIHSMLDKDPEGRISISEIMKHEWYNQFKFDSERIEEIQTQQELLDKKREDMRVSKAKSKRKAMGYRTLKTAVQRNNSKNKFKPNYKKGSPKNFNGKSSPVAPRTHKSKNGPKKSPVFRRSRIGAQKAQRSPEIKYRSKFKK